MAVLVIDPNDHPGTIRQLVEMIESLESRLAMCEMQIETHRERDQLMDDVIWAHFDALAEAIEEVAEEESEEESEEQSEEESEQPEVEEV